MKFNKSGQLLLASAASLAAACLLSACSTLTVDFVYVTSARAAGANNYGEIDVFEVNSESGHMRQIPTSPFPSGGRNPVAEAVSADHNHLFVVNEDDNTIVQFTIGNDGKLYPQQTVNTPGVFPMAVAVAGGNLYVADTFQPLPTCSQAAPCTGSIASFPVATTGTLGTPAVNGTLSTSYWPLTLPSNTKDVVEPTAITALASGNSVYVAAYDLTAKTGYIYGFASASGALSPLNNGVPVAAGVHPSAIISDPTGSYLFVADSASANILAYSIGSGVPTLVAGSPFATGGQPSALAIDSTGKFLAETNAQDSTLNTYSVSSGVLTFVGTFATGLQPVAVGIDPSMNQYIYTADFLGNTVTGYELNSTGSLLVTQNSPFASNAQPTAVAAIPHNGSKK